MVYFRHPASRVKLGSAALVAGLALAASPCRGQNLITNGGFELGPNPGSFASVCPPSTSITGWTVIRDCVHYMGSYWVADDGVRSLDLDALEGDSGGISQSFATTPGRLYLVSFSLAGNYVSGPALKRMRVLAAGASAEFTFDITGRSSANMGWTRHRWSFTAVAPLTTLEFWSVTSPSGYGPALDRVSVGCAADFDGDGTVDFFDYDAFVQCFEGGVCPPGMTADFDGDGTVDFFDYDAFVVAFEAGC